MAGLLIHIPSGEVSLSAGVAKTALEVTAAANHRVKLLGVEIFFKGISTTDTPVKVDLARITTTGTGTAGTALKNDVDDDETIQTTFEFASSVEPTYGNVIKTWEVHPQTGLIFYFPMGQEIVINGGDLFGVRCNAAQAQTVSVNLLIEE